MDFRILMQSTKTVSIDTAASILNASDEYVRGLIDSGQLDVQACDNGSDTVLLSLSHLKRFKSRIDVNRSRTLEELAREAQSLQMGY